MIGVFVKHFYSYSGLLRRKVLLHSASVTFDVVCKLLLVEGLHVRFYGA